jgi:hypothetical protein
VWVGEFSHHLSLAESAAAPTAGEQNISRSVVGSDIGSGDSSSRARS